MSARFQFDLSTTIAAGGLDTLPTMDCQAHDSLTVVVRSDRSLGVVLMYGPDDATLDIDPVAHPVTVEAGTPFALHRRCEGRYARVILLNNSVTDPAIVSVEAMFSSRSPDHQTVQITQDGLDVSAVNALNVAAQILPGETIQAVQDNPANLQATVTQAGIVDVCARPCNPLLVASAQIAGAGSTAINIIPGPCRVHAFAAANSAQGSIIFYDVAGTDPAPTSATTSDMAIGIGGTTALASPMFPAGSYQNFANGLSGYVQTPHTWNRTPRTTTAG